MFQLALLGSGMQGFGQGQGVARSAGGEIFSLLFQGQSTDSGDFAAALEELLALLPPDVSMHLDEMLQSGMSLPQAANLLLSDATTEGETVSLETFLSQSTETPEVTKQGRESVTGAVIAAAARSLGQPVPAAVDPAATAQAPAAMAAPAPAHATTAAQATLPTQLAANLLDMPVPEKVGSRGWPDAVGERVLWMTQGDHQFARLKLNPPQLGPLEIRISVTNDQSSVAFIAQHAATREALEAAIPRLREMFDDASLQLVRADVGDPSAGRGDSSGTAADGHAHGNGLSSAMDDSEPGPLQLPEGIVHASSLVDLFA